MNKKYGLGFTLTELMITVAIIGIVATMAAPSFVDLIERTRLKTAIEAFNSDFQYAKMQSVKQNRPVYIAFTGTGTTWCYGISNTAGCKCTVTDKTVATACTIWEDADQDTVEDTDEKMLKIMGNDSFTNIELDSVSYADAEITFSSINATAEDGNVTFKNNIGSLQVKTTILGRSRYCSVGSAWGGYNKC